MARQRTRSAKSVLEKVSKFRGLPLPDFRTYREGTKDSVVLANGQTYKLLGRRRGSRNRPTQVRPSDFHSEWRKGSVFTKQCRKRRSATREKVNVDERVCTDQEQ